MVEMPLSLGISNASVSTMKRQAQSKGSDVASGLKAEDNVEVKTESQVAAALRAMFAGLPNEEHRRSFGLMRRIKEIPAFISTLLSTTGYSPSAGMGDLYSCPGLFCSAHGSNRDSGADGGRPRHALHRPLFADRVIEQPLVQDSAELMVMHSNNVAFFWRLFQSTFTTDYNHRYS